MDPITTAVVASAQIPRVFLVAVSRAVVPLLLGIVCACVAGGFYAVFLAHQKIEGFFSSAAGIATGVLIALIVNG
jgi:threonine/homoserine efflux transporter RhtA